MRLTAALALVLLAAAAAAEPWSQRLGFELLFNEGYYSANWQGDEQTSGSVSAGLTHAAARQLARPLRLEHELVLGFGQLLQLDSAGAWTRSKTEDKIRLNDVLRFTLGAWVDPLVSLEFKSQFLDAGATPAAWLNPLQFLETGGIGRRFFDDSTRALSSQFGFSARQLSDRLDTAGLVADAGLSWQTAFRTIVVTRNTGYSTRLTLYKPLFTFGSAAPPGTWPVADWEHTLSARFNKALSAQLYVQVLFDELVASAPRLRQTLGLGLSLAWPALD